MSRQRPSAQAVNELLQRGFQLHQQGQWDIAAALYQDALKLQPRNFDALHLLGTAYLQMKNATAAIEWLRKAAAENPRDPGVRSTLGVALQAAGRLDEALASFDHAVQLQPAAAEFHYNRGKILRELGRPEDALASYGAALQSKPDYAQAWNNRCEILLSLGRHEEALADANRALQILPDYPEALNNRGTALVALEQSGPALDSLDRALALNPDSPNAHFNRGCVYATLKRYPEALADYDRAIHLRPDWIKPLSAKAEALRQLNQHEEARACAESILACTDRLLSIQPRDLDALLERGRAFNELRRPTQALDSQDRALALNPDHAGALIDRGNALMRLNRFAEARADYEKAARIAPDDASAHWNLCLCLLLTGEFEKGWAEYDSRWLTHLKNVRQTFAKPRWDGSTVSGTLLIWGEQGVGDHVIYASMLKETAGFAGHTIVATDARLLELFTRSFPGIEFTTMEQALEDDDYDVQVPMGDLGLHLRRDVTDFINNRATYLKADAGRTAGLRQVLARPATLVCGLSWSSSNNTVGREKSMNLGSLLPVLSLPDFRFVDLQYGDTADERAGLLKEQGIDVMRIEEVDTWNDIDGLAALTDACDVIVTISNTTANIAGALGKEVYLMLPYSQGRFWYWQTERSDTLWYPNVRVFRQPAEGDWDSVIAQVRDALQARAPTPV